jgi:hypothetical protein
MARSRRQEIDDMQKQIDSFNDSVPQDSNREAEKASQKMMGGAFGAAESEMARVNRLRKLGF